MPLFLWDSSLEVGVREFDEQHKKLFELLNKLYDAMLQGKDKEIIIDVLDEMVDYTNYHFDCEERLFIEYGYENTNAHIKQHSMLREKTMELKYKAKDAFNNVITLEVLLFLTDWIYNHIKRVDKRYSYFTAVNGLE